MKAVMTPILPCGDLDESISFYEALGFRRSYRRQVTDLPLSEADREAIATELAHSQELVAGS